MLPFLFQDERRMEHTFAPDGERARAMDARAHALLADSLEHIAERAGDLVGAHALAARAADLKAGHRFGPTTFGFHYQLATALMDGRVEEARRINDALVATRSAPDTLSVLSLRDLPPSQASLYQQLMDTDPQTRFALLPPPEPMATGFVQRLQRTVALLHSALPELAQEFAGLIREVCMVVGDHSAPYQFDGGSSYMLWGGLFLNIESHETDLQLVEVLAHESAHSLLFGYALDEALVLNDDEELFPSPLRVDKRPMDGIYHATFVSARMHWAMSRLLHSVSLNEQERAEVTTALQRDAENFAAGDDVVQRHGRLTATGHAVISAARHYMHTATGAPVQSRAT
jgi:HEXXH motif-containing protein